MAVNECIPFYEPGRRITGQATAAITGKRFLAITGNRVSDGSLALTAATDGGNIAVAHATAAGRICGVSSYDAASGAKVGVHRGNSTVVPVTAAATITAFQEVEVATGGMCTPKASGVAVGYALTGCASGADAQISLY
jgi:hypothetical protein